MKKVKIETTQSRISEKSPRGSISEKSPLMSVSKINSFPKPQFSTIEEEISHLPYKENEIQLLAKQIGIDFQTEKDKYLWFLIQVANLDLPPGWIREEDPKGGLYYHNPNENLTSVKHPMISKFRSLFNEILENEIAGKSKMLALKEKVQKFDEEKEGQASKKMKEPFKLDKAKKFKAAATAIAMTAALSGKINKDDSPFGKFARSVPEPPQSIIDSEKLQGRFNKVKEILEKRRVEQEDKTNEIDNLVRTEEVLNISKLYYLEQYGSEHKDLPPLMLQIEGFDLIDPMDIIEAAKLFNVRSTQAYLFWVLRAYCGLPLPEYWNKTFDTNLHREIYYNSCYDVKISVKPCYFYILELINFIKQEAIRDKDSFLHFSNKITLSDKLGRQYDVDLASMIKDLTEKTTNERKNYFSYHQKKEVAKEEVQKVTKKRKKDDFNPNYSDAHFIEIANQLQVDLSSEIHLLMVIEDFVRSREPVERWFYRQASDGPSFWVNHEQQKAVNRYPYAKELKIIIDEIRNNFKNQTEEAKNHMKPEFSLIKMLFRKYPEDVGRKMLSDEAKNYVEFFLKTKTDGSSSTTNAESKGYNLAGLMRKIGTHLSKHDIMDLLFYCPFDFSHYLGEDFLQSSENYLMKKLRLKNNNNNQQEGSGDEELNDLHDGSFESQDSNDSAKKIRLKIEDSKKLLDLAANIKGLNLDPEKKREFMKLLIDFDQKYGDHDLVDALEQDVTENLKEEAATMKNLANVLKSKMKKDEEEGRDSMENKNLKKMGQDSNKNAINPSNNVKARGDASQKEQETKTKKTNDNTSSNVIKSKTNSNKMANKKDSSVSIIKKDPSPTKSTKDTRAIIVEGEESEDTDLFNENQDSEPPNKKKMQGLSALALEENEARLGAPKKNKGKSVIVDELDNLEEEGSAAEISSQAQGSNVDIVDASFFERGSSKGQESTSPQKISSSKFILDETGKIIFTSKKTQELLENLVEEENTSTKRKNRRDTKGTSSGQGSVEGEIEGRSSFGQLGSHSQAFDDHEIIYQEFITENGERKLVPINIKAGSKKDIKQRGSLSPSKSENRSKSPTDFEDRTESQKMINSSSSKKLLKNNSTKKIVAGPGSRESLGGDGTLPIVIGSSLKQQGGRSIFGNTESQWDPNILVETLHRYNHDNLDTESKGEKRKQDLEPNGDESKFGEAAELSLSRNQLTPNSKLRLAESKQAEAVIQHQTYKSLEPGLHHLDINYNRNKNKQKNSKLGLWTHVELFEMEDSSPSQSLDKSILEYRKSHYNTAKAHATPECPEEYQRVSSNDKTFFTPFRKGNLGSKRFIDYLSHLNSLMFVKKLNTLITNFLIKRFAAIQIQSLGMAFKPEDPVFRALFQKRYQKLIKQLRENLLKKKEFINHIYTKVITNSDNLQDMIFPNLVNIHEAAKHRHTHSNREQNHSPSLMVGKINEEMSPQRIELSIKSSNKHVSVMENKSQPNFKLPKLINHKKSHTNNYKTSYRGFKSPLMENTTEDSLFSDNKFRTAISLKHEETWTSAVDLNKNRSNFFSLSTKQNEVEKILKSLNGNDQENYNHYWALLGDPLKVNCFSSFSRTDTSLGIQPYHVLLMANRLGLQAQNTEEPDLAWIAYLALSLKLPVNNETNLQITSPKIKNRYQKICNMKYGEHPGDKFFKTVLIYQQMRRKVLFEYMSLEEQTQFIKSQSWVKLREETGGIYYYNFFTRQKAWVLPGDHKDILSKASALSLRAEIKEKFRLVNQVVQENDHLFALFKNKFSSK